MRSAVKDSFTQKFEFECHCCICFGSVQVVMTFDALETGSNSLIRQGYLGAAPDPAPRLSGENAFVFGVCSETPEA